MSPRFTLDRMQRASSVGLAFVAALIGVFTTHAAFAQDVMQMTHRTLPAIRQRLADIISGSNNFWAEAVSTLEKASPDGTLSWHLEVLGWTIGAMVIANFIRMGTSQWLRQHFYYLFDPNPKTRGDKISYLLTRTFMMLIHIVIFAIVASLISFGINGSSPPARATLMTVIGAFTLILVFRALSLNLIAPDAPSHRLLPIDDSRAWSLHRALVIAFSFATVVFFTCMWMFQLGLPHDPHTLLLVTGAALITIFFVFTAIQQRGTFALLISNGKAAEALPVWRRLIAMNIHVVLAIYFTVAFVAATTRLLLDLPIPFSPITSPLTLPIFAGYSYMILLLAIDLAEKNYRQRKIQRAALDFEIVDLGDKVDDDAPYPGRNLRDVADDAAALLIFAGIALALSNIWDLGVFGSGEQIFEFLDILIVAFVGYTVYDAIRVVIDRRIWEEGDDFQEPEPGEEGSAKSATRLATLLPLARNFMLITVFAMTGMILASQAGVDIAPLFAGAGVIGLAVGFGAQALIADIFSGAFFLIDDAFRKGDYVDTGAVKGTVERISIRSMQLRHHMGALHTIPFGQITQITNYSRDWAMMKLKLRLTYDTDVELVRKLIKKLGQQLQQDPEIGDKFLQPVKSQGVYAMEDSAMIIRVKFMTRPGEQFTVRKKVYSEIRSLFEQNGIEFAHKQVTVRVAREEGENKDEEPKALTDQTKEAIAGAASSAIEEAAKPAGGDDR